MEEKLIIRGIEALFAEYLENASPRENTAEMELSGISATLDGMIDKGTVSHEIIGEYEGSARRAGFYAGVQAAMALVANGRKARGAESEVK